MSMLKPTARQLAYQDWEFGLFLHFGLRTFYEGYRDFDPRPMSPEAFNPKKLDCEQWIRTAKEAGMNYAVLTAKHHDGFSNWPSAYSSFTVAQSPWSNGNGDVVREFVDACRKYDVKPGLYYSPFDGSADFYNQDEQAYDEYFIHQITELLTQYGPIDILWFDGCGSEGHVYDWKRIMGHIRGLQPDILIFNMGDPDFRWVGNEDGIAPIPCWNVTSSTDISVLTEERENLEGRWWLPAECDVPLRENWFYNDHDVHTMKGLDELMGIYYYSIGRGANLLLNIGPGREGLLPGKDAQRLMEFGQEIRRRFDRPIAILEQFKSEEGKWTYTAAEPHLMDHMVIQEDLTNGEAVVSFKVTVITAKTGRPFVIYEGKNIGHKAIIRLPVLKVRGVILEVTEFNTPPVLRTISLHHSGSDSMQP